MLALDVLSMEGAREISKVDVEIMAWAALVVVLLNAGSGLYEYRRAPSALSAIPSLCSHGSTALFLSLAVAATGWSGGVCRIGLKSLAAAYALYLILSCAGRGIYFASVRGVRRQIGRGHRTLVIGTGVSADRISSVLKEHPEYGLTPFGFIALADDQATVPIHPAVLGKVNDLKRVLTIHKIDTVIVSMAEIHNQDLDTVVRVCAAMDRRVVIAPSDAAGRLIRSSRVEYVRGIPTTVLARQNSHGRAKAFKRTLDIALATCALVVGAPLFGLCALLLRLESGPGVIFKQRRIGLDGQAFVMFKFRTLKPSDEEEGDTRWSIENDDRVRFIGRLLRATSLDELPQLWNVVRGEMSLVGPRPERPHFVQRFSASIPAYSLRHRVPPGLTGWAQVHGLRGDTCIYERVRLDNLYIENWSIWGDIRILLMTLWALLPKKRGPVKSEV